MEDYLEALDIAREMDIVENTIRQSIKSESPLLTEIAMHVVEAGGKRIRPAICVLAFRAVGGKEGKLLDAVDAAVAVELIHSATLIHDDITDEGETRRGRVTAYRKYGVHNAIVTGDFLFVQGFKYGRFLDLESIRIAAEAYERLAEGEMLQEAWKKKIDIPEDEYIKIISGKTASVFSASAQLGAFHGGGTPEQIEGLGEYGTSVGIAFQIVDDVLDIISDERVLGKSTGNDLKEGNMTLPLIYAMNDGVDKELLAKLVTSDVKTPQMINEALHIIRKSNAIQRSMTIAEGFVGRAKEALSCLPPSAYKQRLKNVADAILKRTM
ncbi:MAG: polyprenyl synthetase family protein [Methanomassiliicoccales archaeon]